METRRWLLPFTWGMDMQAIDAAVRLAEGSGATLVAVSLISKPDGSRGVRLEHIQQSKDFLAAVELKANQLRVPLNRHEVITVDAIQSITTLTHELRCDAIVLVSRGEREALLRAHQLKRLLVEPPASLLVLRLTRQTGEQLVKNTWLGARIWARLRQRMERGEGQHGPGPEPAPEEPLWIRSEAHRRGMSL
ncbi:MAG TPA: universal stress protein [Ktedonobacteraceae bacterium]|nr:universal stress protein [Ktedonobacteraceae bacterium]